MFQPSPKICLCELVDMSNLLGLSCHHLPWVIFAVKTARLTASIASSSRTYETTSPFHFVVVFVSCLFHDVLSGSKKTTWRDAANGSNVLQQKATQCDTHDDTRCLNRFWKSLRRCSKMFKVKNNEKKTRPDINGNSMNKWNTWYCSGASKTYWNFMEFSWNFLH